uniref:Uncharacterized protein n=1 Tax=Anguilla anguilla TaxID=7936 RepID=A0A0E9VXN8_ANGAN
MDIFYFFYGFHQQEQCSCHPSPTHFLSYTLMFSACFRVCFFYQCKEV